MSSFLDIGSIRLEESCEKCVLKSNILQNSPKNIHDAVNLIKFQAKGLQLHWKEAPTYVFPKNFADVLRTPIL